MNKIAPIVLTAACLALAACGHSDKASDPASADNVEMPAEEAMSGIDAAATAAPDAAATARDSDSAAAQSASDAASATSAQPD